MTNVITIEDVCKSGQVETFTFNDDHFVLEIMEGEESTTYRRKYNANSYNMVQDMIDIEFHKYVDADFPNAMKAQELLYARCVKQQF